MPNETKRFADLTYLGGDDSDYFLHYRKQTNKDGADEFDYSSIRDFISLINHTSDADFEETILENFAVEEFIRYLVVANFSANWDSYPYRPKNFSLYNNPEDGKWHFIPWDLDGTFQEGGNRNSIGATGSIYHYFDGIAPYNHTANEPLNRPLVWRLMENDWFRDKYCYEYHQAIDTYLSKDYLYQVIDSMALGVSNNTSGQELTAFNQDVVNTKNFISKRVLNVTSQLNDCVIETDPFTDPNYGAEPEPTDTIFSNLLVFPNPATDYVTVQLPDLITGTVDFQIVNILGQTLKTLEVEAISDNIYKIETKDIDRGQYILIIKTTTETFTVKLLINN